MKTAVWGVSRSRLLMTVLLVGGFACADVQTSTEPEGYDSDYSPPMDLDVGWISRADPRIPFEKRYDQSEPEEGWPVPGQVVTWTARLINWSQAPAEGVGYEWHLDGVTVEEGTLDLPAGGQVDVPLQLPWSGRREQLEFRVDPAGLIDEVEEANNQVTVATDALAVALWIETSLYQHFRSLENSFGEGTNSFEDWAQYQVRRWNKLFANAKDPELAPDGVLDRLRLDYVRIWPDGTFKPGAQGRNDWWLADSTVDMRYVLPSHDLGDPFQFLHVDMSDYVFAPSLGSMLFLHEMLHMRNLTDLYRLDVRDDPPWGSIKITEGGQPVVGSRFMPLLAAYPRRQRLVYEYPDQGLMGYVASRLSVYSTVLLNRWAGRRTHKALEDDSERGYWGELPAENRLTVTDEEGNVLSGARVDIYRDSATWIGSKFYDDTPDVTLTAGKDGEVLLGHNPFLPDPELPGYFSAVKVLIVRVALDDRVGYGFLPVTDFNLEKWRGHEVGEYTLAVKLLPKDGG